MFVRRTAWAFVGALSLVGWASPAWAQDDDETSEAADGAEASETADGESAEKPEAPAEKYDEKDAPPATETSSVKELKGQSYKFIGVRYRMVFIPQFIQGIFADGGATAVVQQPGLEFGIREDGFEYSLFGMLGFYGMNETPFKGKTDPSEAWEIVKPDFKILYVGSDFMWSTPEFAPGLSVHYGAGIGIGIVFGGLARNQAYPTGGSVNDPASYTKCPDITKGAINPSLTYCTNDNNHYGNYSESSPSPVFPWIAGQIGLRYKAHKNFVLRLDAGIMVPGAFIGIGADYGI
jgi:hypothetical protein